MRSIRKKEGFKGQRAIVLPREVVQVCDRTPPVSALFVTDLGYYPRARYHFRERASGIRDNILIYCTEGKGWLTLPSGTYNVQPNHLAVIPAGMPHKYAADTENPWSIYWVHFKGSQASFFTSLLSRHPRGFVSYTTFIEDRLKVFDSLYSNFESGYSLDNLVFASLSFQYYLLSFAYSDRFAPRLQYKGKDPVDASIQHMQDHLATRVTLEELAAAVNLSVSHYASVFKSRTGYSPIGYFNHLKIQRACQYLQFTTLRINEISVKVGIDDPYYFSRLFTKVMGISPNDYRRRQAGADHKKVHDYPSILHSAK